MRLVTCTLAVCLLAMMSGCDQKWDPAKAAKQAKLAGGLAAASWVAAAKPTKDQVAAVKFVVDDITKNLQGYKEGGFAGALPGIKEGIDKALPKEEQKALRVMAYKLAETLVDELDALFKRHPDWQTKGAEVAGIVAGFTTGASDTLQDVK